MRCPHCDTDGVYVGLLWIHCISTSCKYYDARYAQKVMGEAVLGDLYEKHLRDKVEKLILLRGKTQDTKKP
jgi:hypothetical protein